jgi:hypothetical protein
MTLGMTFGLIARLADRDCENPGYAPKRDEPEP